MHRNKYQKVHSSGLPVHRYHPAVCKFSTKEDEEMKAIRALIKKYEEEKKKKANIRIRCPYDGCKNAWKNIHTPSVKAHIAFKCKFIVDGKTKIKEFYRRKNNKKFFTEFVG